MKNTAKRVVSMGLVTLQILSIGTPSLGAMRPTAPLATPRLLTREALVSRMSVGWANVKNRSSAVTVRHLLPLSLPQRPFLATGALLLAFYGHHPFGRQAALSLLLLEFLQWYMNKATGVLVGHSDGRNYLLSKRVDSGSSGVEKTKKPKRGRDSVNKEKVLKVQAERIERLLEFTDERISRLLGAKVRSERIRALIHAIQRVRAGEVIARSEAELTSIVAQEIDPDQAARIVKRIMGRLSAMRKEDRESYAPRIVDRTALESPFHNDCPFAVPPEFIRTWAKSQGGSALGKDFSLAFWLYLSDHLDYELLKLTKTDKARYEALERAFRALYRPDGRMSPNFVVMRGAIPLEDQTEITPASRLHIVLKRPLPQREKTSSRLSRLARLMGGLLISLLLNDSQSPHARLTLSAA